MQYFPLPLLKSTLHEQFCYISQKYIQKSQDMRVPFVAEKQKKQKKEISICTRKTKTS